MLVRGCSRRFARDPPDIPSPSPGCPQAVPTPWGRPDPVMPRRPGRLCPFDPFWPILWGPRPCPTHAPGAQDPSRPTQCAVMVVIAFANVRFHDHKCSVDEEVGISSGWTGRRSRRSGYEGGRWGLGLVRGRSGSAGLGQAALEGVDAVAELADDHGELAGQLGDDLEDDGGDTGDVFLGR